MDDFVEMFQLEGLGYNDYLIRQGKTLKDICKNDKSFDIDFDAYLKSFDPETKYLLGVDKGTEEEKFLDISGISGQLKKKRILFETVKAWSEIDLTPFNNSEITTLEEHIKRKWADISAETAGEQYTPDDIISLISELIASRLKTMASSSPSMTLPAEAETYSLVWRIKSREVQTPYQNIRWRLER